LNLFTSTIYGDIQKADILHLAADGEFEK